MKLKNFDLIIVLGATASGKTSFAACLAEKIDGEIISADSRQVYRDMDIGTGKDYSDYIVNDKKIPFHLIDIVEAGNKYNVYEFQKDFLPVFKNIKDKNKIPVLCGGSGMYIDAAVKGYRLIHVPPDNKLRALLDKKPMDELEDILRSFRKLHNVSDIKSKKRLIRAIEIESYYAKHADIVFEYPKITPIYIGIKFDRDSRRRRITKRLKERLDSGMIEEVEKLLESGITPEDLIFYGLEYKYITNYLLGNISYENMFFALETAIHQFSKRQMTWYRGMERKGVKIHWLDGQLPLNDKIDRTLTLLNN